MIDLDQSLRDFSRDFDAATKGRPWQEVGVIQRTMALQGLNGVIYRTPVDTGRARGNWQTTVGEPASGSVDVDLHYQLGGVHYMLTGRPRGALIDLALLQNGMLKGASLDAFLKRSVDMIK